MTAQRQLTARGPGRVNLIGEHTDYNDGLCLPFAIERGVTVHGEATGSGTIEAEAVAYGERDSFPADAPSREGADGWRAFVRGAVAELRATGVEVPGARLRIEADLPDGVGLSSSAALESALCLALLGLAGAPEGDRVELAKLCSRIEHDWVGAETGLLDQLAALFGREGAAVRLDCRTLALEPVPLELGEAQLCTIDSGSTHTHAGSGYNARRAECRQAAAELGLESLRDAGAEDVARLPDPLDRRVRHVVTENARVDATVAALQLGDLEEVGRLLDASHASLRDDYEASVPEVEATVDAAKAAGALGARMVGGGFGGSVLALFPPGVALPEGAFSVRPGPAARLL
jgi:galactokinase